MKLVRYLMILLIAPLSAALGHETWGHMMDWGHSNYWQGGVIMFLILFLGLIGVVVYFIINQKKMGRNYREYENETVMEILKHRYAKGEITNQQYEEMKKVLN